MVCKEVARGYAGYQWTFRVTNDVIMEEIWTWENQDGLESDSDPIREVERREDFKKELCLELGKSMWRNHQSVFQYHVKYIHNDIVRLSRVGII